MADRDSLDHDTGHTIDWANVPAAAPYLDSRGNKFIRAGTVMGELLSGNGSLSPRTAPVGTAASTNPATCILATNANQNSRTDSRSGYGVILGGVLYDNLLPDATGIPAALPAAVKTELQVAGVGTGFSFLRYTDSTTA